MPPRRSAPAVVALAAGTVAATLVAILALSAAADATAPHSPLPPRVHQAAVGIPVALAVYAAYRRAALRRPASFYRLHPPTPRTLAWIAAGVALPGAVLLLHLAVQDLVFAGAVRDPAVAATYLAESLAAGLLAGVVEEVAFRGYLLRLIEERWSATTGVAVTSILFAALHQGHAGSTLPLVLVFASTLAAGVLLALVVLRSGSVANAVAVHAGWNAVIGGRIVAMAPPGEPPSPAILAYRLEGGGPLLTGGEATVGAAPLTIAALVAAAWLLARAPART